MADYLKIVYDTKTRPKTTYPAKFASLLFLKYGMKAGETLLEAGCGRGEFLAEFQSLGLKCTGIDLSPQAGSLAPGVEIKTGVNFDQDIWPFPDNHFDIIYNKSVIEHLRRPDYFLKEAHRVLKPGGKMLCLTPDWETQYITFFDDFTHHTPFTTVSMNVILQMCDFSGIEVYKFRQLPIVWKYPIINRFCAFISPFINIRTKKKFLRWSRELMLFGYATKPFI